MDHATSTSDDVHARIAKARAEFALALQQISTDTWAFHEAAFRACYGRQGGCDAAAAAADEKCRESLKALGQALSDAQGRTNEAHAQLVRDLQEACAMIDAGTADAATLSAAGWSLIHASVSRPFPFGVAADASATPAAEPATAEAGGV